ncbi:hypothetical protein SDC9_186954 [bioreactor metagenome]|uniref:Uncharacterized protein n=1 Tax=bioreactor metagenome TaxID=1076179 RepID=A0A645HLL4_9ZZZZ
MQGQAVGGRTEGGRVPGEVGEVGVFPDKGLPRLAALRLYGPAVNEEQRTTQVLRRKGEHSVLAIGRTVGIFVIIEIGQPEQSQQQRHQRRRETYRP